MSKVVWETEGTELKAYVVAEDGTKSLATWAPQPGSQERFLACPVFEVLYEGTRGPGKGLKLQEKLLTQRGWIEAQQVNMDDLLVAPDGTYTSLRGIFPQSPKPLNRVTFDDGASCVVDDDHRWKVYSHSTGYKQGWVVRDTRTLRESKGRWSIPYMEQGVPGAPYDGPDAYMAGMLLGDGTMRSKYPCLYGSDEEHHDHAISLGWTRYEYPPQVPRTVCPARDKQQWIDLFEGRHKGPDKRVPIALMRADAANRLAVLQGLLDTDGSIFDGKGRFVSSSKQLAEDVAELVWSLGGRANCYLEHRKSPLGGKDYRWRVNWSHNNRFMPFRLKRKADKVTVKKKCTNRRIVSIDQLPPEPTVCFAVEHPSHCFVIHDYIVTHNTDALIMDFAQHVGQGFGADWRGILFRMSYPQLQDVINKTQKWYPAIFGKACRYNRSEHFWEWDTGETLLLRHMKVADDYWNYHGHAYPWIGFEELTNWPDAECYVRMFSCCRSTNPNMPRKVRATANPYGAGHNWVKSRFRLPIPHGRIAGPVIRDDFNEETRAMDPPRVAIHGSIHENKILLTADPDYIARIQASAPNPAALAAWLEGRWDIVAGGMFDDVWNRQYHVLPHINPINIPRGWRIDRSYDHGQSKPFSVGWWAQSNGEPMEIPGGQLVGTVRGDLIRFMEWYGWNGKPDKGLRMSSKDIANGILDREEDAGLLGKVRPGPADSSIFDRFEGTKSVAGEMKKEGVKWTAADKSSGSRKQGWQQIREMLQDAVPEPDGTRDSPGLFIAKNCKQTLRTVPVLARDENDPDDVDTRVEDHIADEMRYRVRAKRSQVSTTTRK